MLTLFIFKVKDWGGGGVFSGHLAASINSTLDPVQRNTENYHKYMSFEGGGLCVLVKHLFWHFQFLCLVSKLWFSFVS